MWHFRFLGNLSAERDGVVTTLAPRKYTALLAYLVLHPARRWSRDELAAQFWPDSDAEAGRAALRTALSGLRKTFGPVVIDTRAADTVCAGSDCFTTDTARFENLTQKAVRAASSALPLQEARLLEEAVALYAGPLLPGIYDDWAVLLREHFDKEYERAHNRLAALQKIALQESESQAAEERYLRKTEGPVLLCLPLYNTGLVGREAELFQIAESLCARSRDLSSARSRLWTLTGPGGIGKTRLAVETAKRIASRFSGAVCFVPLAALSSGEEIGVALAEALQLDGATGSGADPLQQAMFRLDDLGPSLLVLDNVEQLVDTGAASVARTLLAGLPHVTLLITSRRLLGVEGECEFPLAPLDAEACQKLFSLHARAARPDFGDDGGDGETLCALCKRLEGIPLAVELCAPWVRVLTPAQMLHHLDDRFRLLTSRRSDVPSRHRSLHAALDWGCPTDPNLLQFFAALSVFRGGFTLAAAEAVGGKEALEHLAALREQSLVLAESPAAAAGNNGMMRYRMLETIREFAGEKLTGELETDVRRRSLAYFKQLACDLAPRLATKDSARFFAALEAESANFRACVEWGLHDTPESLQFAYALMEELHWFWGIRGHRPPFDQWRQKACARRDELADPLRTHLALQYAVYYAPEAEQESRLLAALEQFNLLNDGAGIVTAHERLGTLYHHQNRFDKMEIAFRTAAEIRRASGDTRGYGYVLANLAGAYFQSGRTSEARTLWKECREIAVRLDEWGGVAVLDRAAGYAFLGEGRVEEAIPLLEDAAQTFRHKGETWHLLDTLRHLGDACGQSKQTAKARAVWHEALLLARQFGDAYHAQRFADLLKASPAPADDAPVLPETRK